MINRNRLFRPLFFAALLCGVTAGSLFAQGPEAPGLGGHHPGRHHGPPPSPLFDALDTNHDGIISADEMANASTSLKSLLKNGATQLTREDFRPTPPAAQPSAKEDVAPGGEEAMHPRPPAIREHQPPHSPEEQTGPEFADQTAPPRGGPLAHRGPQGEEGERHRGLPPGPIFDALDTNHDGVISEDEMSNAANTLKSLLKKGSTELRRDDVRPGELPDRREH